MRLGDVFGDAGWGGLPLAFVIAAACAALRLLDPAPVEGLRLAGFDTFQRMRSLHPPAERPVLIVDIDEESLAALGQWPWPRWRVASLVEAILSAEPASVAVSILFSEPDRLSPDRVAVEIPGLSAAAREALAGLPSNDERLGAAIGRGPVTLAAVGVDFGVGGKTVFRSPVRLIGDGPQQALTNFPGSLTSLDVIRYAARGEGAVNVPPERDNIVRQLPALVRMGDQLVPHLMIDALRLAEGAPAIGVRRSVRGIDSVQIGSFEVPTLPDGRIWPRLSPPDAGRFISAAAVLADERARAQLRGRIVILASTAASWGDFHATPIAPRLAGSEVQAQAIEAILMGELLQRPPGGSLFEAGLVGLIALLAALLLPYRRPLLATALLAAGAYALIAGSFVAFDYGGMLIDPLNPIVASGLVFIQMLAVQLRATDRERGRIDSAKRELTRRFGRYLAPVLIERLEENPAALALGGEARRVTVLFTDIAGYTTLSESLRHEPQRLIELTNAYFTAMVEVIEGEHGYVDKFIGDSVMGVWGAPGDEPAQEIRAVNAALACRDRLDKLNAEVIVGKHGLPPIRARVGINTGIAIVGNMGSPTRLNYTVTGDTVNVASRLEGANKTYGTSILIGPDTAAAVRAHFVLRHLGLIEVRGKEAAVDVFEVVGPVAAEL